MAGGGGGGKGYAVVAFPTPRPDAPHTLPTRQHCTCILGERLTKRVRKASAVLSDRLQWSPQSKHALLQHSTRPREAESEAPPKLPSLPIAQVGENHTKRCVKKGLASPLFYKVGGS